MKIFHEGIPVRRKGKNACLMFVNCHTLARVTARETDLLFSIETSIFDSDPCAVSSARKSRRKALPAYSKSFGI
jgi:hypothetical protein